MREAFRVEYLLMKDAVVTFQKLEFPFTERKNKQGIQNTEEIDEDLNVFR
jgi:hypothetical protein